jgi:hypothetical protein
MRAHAGVAAEMFQALHEAGVNIAMITTSEIKVTCVIAKADVEKAVRALHARFELHVGGKKASGHAAPAKTRSTAKPAAKKSESKAKKRR